MDNKPTLDEILDKCFDGYMDYYPDTLDKKEAKQQLTKLIADIIGPDYDQYEFGHNDFDETKSDHLNNEHDEQRQRAKDRGIDL